MNCANPTESQIAKFYEGRCIFITGATGFMGKVHTENVRRLGNVEVAAVVGSRPETAKKFADAFGIEIATNDLPRHADTFPGPKGVKKVIKGSRKTLNTSWDAVASHARPARQLICQPVSVRPRLAPSRCK